MSSEFTLIAVLHPQKGKVEQVVSLLKGVAKHALANEPGTLRYEVGRSTKPDQDGFEDIVVVEKYKDKESLRIHGESAFLREFQKTISEQHLMRAPAWMKMVSGQGGYSSKL